MTSYILRRLTLMIPTLFGIMLLNFVIIQAAPGGPVEQMIAKLEGFEINAISRIGGSSSAEVQQFSMDETGEYRGRRGLDPELIQDIEKLYGFDNRPMNVLFKWWVTTPALNLVTHSSATPRWWT